MKFELRTLSMDSAGVRHALKDFALQIVPRQGHQIIHCLFSVDFENTSRQFRLPLRNNLIEARAQTRLWIIALAKGFAETMNHSPLQSCRQVRGRFRRLGVVPDGALFRARGAQHAIKVILSGTTLEVNQLRHAEPAQRLSALGPYRL